MLESIIGLNTATLAEKDVERQIVLASEAGFSAIGLWMSDIGWDADEKRVKAIVEMTNKYHLVVNELCFLKAATSAQRTYDQVVNECEKIARFANILSCPNIVAVSSSMGEIDLTSEQYRKLNAIATSQGAVIALEFSVNAKHFRTFERTLPLVEDSGISLVVDSFHFLVGGSSLISLEKLDPRRIGLVHLSDAEDRPFERLRTVKHDLRTYPGTGVLPLSAFIKRIKGIGYMGSYSTEIWNTLINAGNSTKIAAEARRTTNLVLRGSK